MKSITVTELKEMFDNKEDFQLIDVREEAEYENANINGTLIPLGEIPTRYNEISKDKKSSLETFRNEAKREWDGVSVITGDRMKNLYTGIILFVEVYPEYKELLNRFIKKENGIVGITNNNLVIYWVFIYGFNRNI